MAHFAEIDNNSVVLHVVVINNAFINDLQFPQSEPIGIDFCKSLYGADTFWKQTSYNGNFRKRYAGIGYSYDSTLDAFIIPKPFPSWTLNMQTADWDPPVPYPTDGREYYWNETAQNWILVK